MKRFATIVLGLVLALGLASEALAQQHVTIREINAVPEGNIQQLINLGASATAEQVTELTNPVLLGQVVSFTAVVLTNPYNSGFASWNNELDRPGRIHVFVRDTTARSQGLEGMTMQVVDGSGIVESLVVGDIIDMEGEVTRFNNTVQFAPSSFNVIDEVTDPNDPLLQPVMVTSGDVHNVMVAPDEEHTYGRMQINWANYESLNNQYVRFEEAQVLNSIQEDAGRPAYLIRSPGTDAAVDSYDVSLRFRNDRAGVYKPPYNVRDADDPFVPPPSGAIINLQGFLVWVNSDFSYPGIGIPNGTVLSITPFEDSDFELLTAAPIISNVSRPTEVLGEGDTYTVTATVEPDPEHTIEAVELRYTFSSDGEEHTVPMTNTGGDTYAGTIPAAGDGVFVSYHIHATDNIGLENASSTYSYRVLFGGITAIEHIQRTASGGPGDSPFNGLTLDMDLDAVVMNDPSVSGFLGIQDDPDLGPWSGVAVFMSVENANLNLKPGDRVHISKATVDEFFGLTQLKDAEMERTGTGEPYAHKVISTSELAQSSSVAESYEGMALRFEDVIVTKVNADGPDDGSGANHGEFLVSSDGSSAHAVRVDDLGDDIPTDWNLDNLEVGAEIEFLQGMWYYSHNNYKLALWSLDDIGEVTVDAEEGAVAGAFRLEPAYPNPFAATTTLRYSLEQPGRATLTVYDVTGRRVATLVEADLPADVHTATFEGRGLASGVYFVRLQAGERVATQKLVLIK